MTQTGDQLPHWTLEDAYGSVTDERYTKELAHVQVNFLNYSYRDSYVFGQRYS